MYYRTGDLGALDSFFFFCINGRKITVIGFIGILYFKKDEPLDYQLNQYEKYSPSVSIDLDSWLGASPLTNRDFELAVKLLKKCL